MRALYRLLMWLVFPVLLALVTSRSLRDGGPRYLRQRMGLGLPELEGAAWFHCASVGEVLTACPLIRRMAQSHPDLPLLITTNTPTGAKVAQQALGSLATHCYLPLDYASFARRLLRRCRPRCLLVCETELWPELYARCGSSGVPVALFNARLSSRTLRAPGVALRLYRQTLRHVLAVLARSQADAEGYRALGAAPGRVEVTGNLKFARCELKDPDGMIDPAGRPYWLAASTHHDEEEALADMWRAIRRPGILAVIAPRHPERGERIARALEARGWRVARRSRHEQVTGDTGIYLADTLGELRGFMHHARVVFMGGSLIPEGGHNLLEPAALGRPILVGPHMEHFQAETQALLERDALVQVPDVAALGEALGRLLDDAGECTRLGRNALAFMQAQEEIADRYLERLESLGILG